MQLMQKSAVFVQVPICVENSDDTAVGDGFHPQFRLMKEKNYRLQMMFVLFVFFYLCWSF